MGLKIITARELKEMISSGRELLAIFSTKWCGYCRSLYKEVEKKGSGLPIVVVDISDDGDTAWEEYRIEMVPTAILFKEGSEAARKEPGPDGISLSDLEEFYSRN
ncbi:MAG: thioredoxin family protein [Candidatus Verstraetearchaeota archaeon]|nr:thioredoxin family protein [Candidatus Verstraetearchaeota archaeon]